MASAPDQRTGIEKTRIETLSKKDRAIAGAVFDDARIFSGSD